MLARMALAVARRMSDERLRSLVDVVFVRTKKQLEQSIADPRAAQEARLQTILSVNANTEIGKTIGFDGIKNLDDWRAKAPITTWDEVSPLVDRMVKGEENILVSEKPFFYATTSGTTGRRKLIPVTSAFVAECRVANKLLYRQTLKAMPQLLKGKRLSLRSPRTEKLGNGSEAGSITVALGGGFEDDEGLFDAVPVDVFFVDDFEKRYFLALRFALQERVTVCSAVNPSTLLLFQRTLAEHADELALALENGLLGTDIEDQERKARLESRARTDEDAAKRIRASKDRHGRAKMRDVFPDLAGLVCWKAGSAPWYLTQLEDGYGALPILDYGYCASEGCFGAPVGTESAESVLVPHGHVIELQPEDGGETLLLHEAEIGKRYRVIVTTSAGLYRYDMNDVVECTGKFNKAPLVVFLHKRGAMASITGEKVGESHVVTAMARAGFTGDGFCASPVLGQDGAASWVVAVDARDADLESLGKRFDDELRKANEEYDAKRKSLRLGEARAVKLPAGAIVKHRARRVADGAPDAHVKVPSVSADGKLLIELGLDESAPEIAKLLPCRQM